jgi:hypothetical protein
MVYFTKKRYITLVSVMWALGFMAGFGFHDTILELAEPKQEQISTDKCNTFTQEYKVSSEGAGYNLLFAEELVQEHKDSKTGIQIPKTVDNGEVKIGDKVKATWCKEPREIISVERVD